MTAARFLKIVLPLLAVPALMVAFLPEGVWQTYVDISQSIALFIGCLLALSVAAIYRKELKAAFIFFAAFLLLYMFAIGFLLSYSSLLFPYLESRLGPINSIRLIEGIQVINYGMLLLFCLNLLKGINVKLTKRGWGVFVFVALISLFIAIYPALDLINNNPVMESIIAFSMRLVDAVLIIILVPVLLLYVQYLRSKQQQSTTFTVIIFGIVFSTLFDYLFDLVVVLIPGVLPQGSVLRSTIPEMLFIYGYLVIAAGLYAHRKQDEWGFRAIDRAMAGELDLKDMSNG